MPRSAGAVRRLLRSESKVTRPAVSSADCVRALTMAGFRPIDAHTRPAVLERDGRVVAVPDVPILDGEALGLILGAAGLSHASFVERLAAVEAVSEVGSDADDLPHSPPSSWPRRIEESGRRARPKVLIVDDDDSMRDLYGWSMLAAGWWVQAVPDGAEALNVAPVFEPDVILMDLHMPVMGGLDATRRLKIEQTTRHVPVVAITAIDAPASELDAREAGCVGFIAKPCEPDTLRRVLESIARRSGG